METTGGEKMASERSYRHNIITPEVRWLHSPDVLDLENSHPENLRNFCILIQAMIGPKNMSGEESFDFLVCTPEWLSDELKHETFIFASNYLIVSKFDYKVIWNAIATLCAQVTGETWSEVGKKLNKYGQWEFEGYVENKNQTK